MSKKKNSSAASNPEVKQFCIIAMNDDEFRWKLASDSVHLVLWWAACISLHSNGRYGSALTGVCGCTNRNNQVIMADACTLSKEGLLDCGSSRGRTETVFLYECRDDVTTHLKIVFFRMQTWKNTRSSCKGLASIVCLMKKWKHYVFVLAIAMVWASTTVSVSRAQRTTCQR